MAIVKQPVDVRFGQGLDQITDPKQVSLGRFEKLVNVVFDKGGRLTKRNGYEDLTSLPSGAGPSVLSSFQDNLLAVGDTVQVYSKSSQTWTNMGDLTPIGLTVAPVARPNAAVTQCDSAVAPNSQKGLGLACTVFTTATGYFYQITDGTTGATIIPATAIPSPDVVNGVPKVFVLGRFFVVVYSVVATATDKLQFIAISLTNPAIVTSAADLTTSYTPAATTAWDGVVTNNSLYVAWNGGDGGGAVRMTYLDSTLVQHATKVVAGEVGTVFGLSADSTGSSSVIYTTYWKASGTLGRVFAVSPTLTTILAPTTFSSSGTIGNLAPYAAGGQVQIMYEVTGTYGYDSALPCNMIKSVAVTAAGSVGSPSTLRGVGLASKAFLLGSTVSVLTLYSGLYENGYFLVDTSSGRVTCKLAYSNATFAAGTAQGYLKTGLPGAWSVAGTTYLGYLQASQIQPVNKLQGGSTTGVYILTGASLAALTPGVAPATAEIGGSLQIAAGLVSSYDGTSVTEQGFNLWPDEVEVTTATTGGHLANQTYFYQMTYEYTDAQGILHRSAPSVPFSIVTTGSDVSMNTVNVPTLRLTRKIGVRIVAYRWSTAQQTYYQCATVNNDTTTDSVAIVDTLADVSIIGNAILYTTGGVVENIGAPPCNVLALFRSRLFLLDAEDRNSVWYSKVVQEATPVEMSDAFTIFCSPTIGSQGSTGPITAMSAMDDKLVLFKKNAAYYETGQGPDATGASNDFQDPVYIASSVGCANPRSIVLTPPGLIFQSDKGRWLLARDLSTKYIGAPVDDLNDLVDSSALTIPGTNQVRITTTNGPTIIYDYYYDQWGTFSTVIDSSCIVGDAHTTLDKFGRIRAESPGSFLDGADPVLISFTTGWGALAGLQGYQRAYFLYLEGQVYSPFTMSIGLAYDYEPAITQQITVTPQPPNAPFGGDPTFGAGYVFGGSSSGKFKPRIFLQRQRCESFQITVSEQYDRTFGLPAGQGFNLSGMTAVVGVKRGWRTQAAGSSFG